MARDNKQVEREKVKKMVQGNLHSRLFLFISLAMIGLSCETERTPSTLRDKLEGRWKVDESSDYYKSTMSTYYVDVSFSEEDSSRIFIANFYQLNDNKVAADVDGDRVELLPSQKIHVLNSTYLIQSGTGIISDDYRSINWQYEVADGSGQIDHVTAVYQKD